MRYGINQRATQELLGHSDANLTAKVYTDVSALGLHDEVAKLPWIGTPALVAGKEAAPGEPHTQSSDNSGHPVARPDFLQQVRDLLHGEQRVPGISELEKPDRNRTDKFSSIRLPKSKNL